MENKVQDRTASRKKRNVCGFFSMVGVNRVRPYGVRWWMGLWYIFGNDTVLKYFFPLDLSYFYIQFISPENN
jgi:hypothetical protein